MSRTFGTDNKLLPTGLPGYQVNESLLNSTERIKLTSLQTLLANNVRDKNAGVVHVGDITLDYSKNLYDRTLIGQLVSLADEAQLPAAIEALFGKSGSFNFGPLHTHLRASTSQQDAGINGRVDAALNKMQEFYEAFAKKNINGFSDKPISHCVILGIGGSYLGPKLCCEALKDFQESELCIDFVSSLDPLEILDVLERADAESTLFIILSKSFATLETLENAKAAKSWLLKSGCPKDKLDRHFAAVTADSDAALEFGVSSDYIFPIWDWVGGRYSLWSAVGLPILLQIGPKKFKQLLAGAREMDLHFKQAPMTENMPVIMALFGIWYRNYWDARSHGIVTYSYRLRSFTEHLQQVDMESNGKSVTRDGRPVNYATGPIIWGGMGNNGQHAYYQLLHQGVELVPVDFILLLDSPSHVGEHHQLLYSSGVGQSQALMQGLSLAQLQAERGDASDDLNHQILPGQQPTNTVLLKSLSPYNLGALIALYEHKVFCQGVIWQIDSFDQCGVELGKALAARIHASLNRNESESAELDQSTRYLVSRYSMKSN